MLTVKQIGKLIGQFEKIDLDHTGLIDAQELSQAMRISNLDLPADEIDKIINEVDYKGNKTISYSDFIAATIQTKSILNDAKLMILFKEFDVDNSGFITKVDLEEAFSKFDKNVSISEIDDIIEKHDLENDGMISFDEFKVMMLGDDELTEAGSKPCKSTQ